MNDEDSLDSFRALGLGELSIEALKEKGFTCPTGIQKECIPLLLEKNVDVIGQAQTGTGKTAAYALAILERLDTSSRLTQALVLTPTRELAMQVAQEIRSLKGSRKISVEAVYGGASYETQFKKLQRGIQIIAGTPGRILDHIERGTLDLSHLSFAVLDEADEMLDMGFIDDISAILSHTNEDKRTLLFSATMPQPILSLASRFMKDYEVVRIESDYRQAHLTKQFFCQIKEEDKPELLRRIIDSSSSFYAIVFCRTKLMCDEIGRQLAASGYNADALHGDLSQKQREIILQKMRDHRISILVATDVAARGIDITNLTHVINYTVPDDAETYTHRIGRTGRAGQSGTAITFVTNPEKRRFSYITRVSGCTIEEYRIPTVQEIMEEKRARIIGAVQTQCEEDNTASAAIACRLLEDYEPQQLVSALISLHYKRELDESQYGTIQPVTADKKKKETKKKTFEKEGDDVRLFFAVGRSGKYTKRTLANMIIAQCNVSDSDLNDIQVMDEFSFVNVPSRLADRIISAFKNKGEGGRPLALRARPEARKKAAPFVPHSRKRKANDAFFFFERENWDDYKGRRKKKDRPAKGAGKRKKR